MSNEPRPSLRACAAASVASKSSKGSEDRTSEKSVPKNSALDRVMIQTQGKLVDIIKRAQVTGEDNIWYASRCLRRLWLVVLGGLMSCDSSSCSSLNLTLASIVIAVVVHHSTPLL